MTIRKQAIHFLRILAHAIVAAACCAALATAQESQAPAPPGGAAPQPDIMWGVNGHPLTSYPGVTLEEQAALLHQMGARSYRVDVTSLNHLERLGAVRAALTPYNIEVLPILIPPVDLRNDDEATVRMKSRAFAEAFVRRYPEIPVWELGNEMENFAIIQPCEMKDDGTQYPCEWGPAGGVGELDYYGPRYRKVAAALSGLAKGVAAVNPRARRAIGTAGWGHTGFFARLAKDGVPWEISVWHWYGGDPEWALKILAEFGKPIWVTEFNHAFGSHRDGVEGQAKGLADMMATLQRLAGRYRIEAAHVYELLDETYWAPNFEAHMGLVRLDRHREDGWRAGALKPAFQSFQHKAARAKAAKTH